MNRPSFKTKLIAGSCTAVIGFCIGGPTGALVGFRIGFAIGPGRYEV